MHIRVLDANASRLMAVLLSSCETDALAESVQLASEDVPNALDSLFQLQPQNVLTIAVHDGIWQIQ